MSAHSPSPWSPEQEAAWFNLTTQTGRGRILRRSQVAQLLDVNPMSVLLYEETGKLTRVNAKGERPALIDCADFGDALRYLITKGLLSKAAAAGRKCKSGPLPKSARTQQGALKPEPDSKAGHPQR